MPGYISPTGFVDPEIGWSNEELAYDGDTGYYASTTVEIPQDTWSSFIELTHTATYCTKVRFYAETVSDRITSIDIDVYYSSNWHDVYEGVFADKTWVEKELASTQKITAFRFRFYRSGPIAQKGILREVEFYEVQVAPIVTVQSPTDILPTTATANGNITDTGGENCTVRGFKYGLTKTDTWDVHDDGDFGTGAYTKGLTGLTANTTYWIRAYATNSIGTSYSEWIEFQTAAVGVIPTGTRIFICSDYTGYTYKLMRSETDDGEAYTAYFVISTDCLDKKGLTFYKRILDLDLYFRSEDAGTAEIYVKRDSEASWKYLGSVTLTGTEDIIIKHLSIDERAKHFLFKISMGNACRFLGLCGQFLPAGDR